MRCPRTESGRFCNSTSERCCVLIVGFLMNTDVMPTAAVQLFSVGDETYYPIAFVARLSQMPRHRVLVCCKRGLITPLVDPDNGSYSFDATSIRVLQRIEYLHTDCGVNFTGIEIILGLVTELERVRRQEP